MTDQMRKDAKPSSETKDLPPKKIARNDEEKVKGGAPPKPFEPQNG